MIRARRFEAANVVPREFDAGRLGRLTWLGLGVALLGWALLVAATVLSDRLAAKGGFAADPTFHADLVAVAQCLIGSGFGLALIGALHTGFGALNRFFSAVLSRSTPRSTPVEEAPSPPRSDVEGTSVRTRRERRPYQILADGSVEVETIVGTRRFASMDEARDFI